MKLEPGLTQQQLDGLPPHLKPLYVRARGRPPFVYAAGKWQDGSHVLDPRRPWPMWYRWHAEKPFGSAACETIAERKRKRTAGVVVDPAGLVDEERGDVLLRPLSAGLAYVEAAHKALPAALSERERGHVLSEALGLAIGAGLRFDLDDFAWLSARHGWPWSTDRNAREWTYSRACAERQNVSCARAFEHHVGRAPFLAGSRVAGVYAKGRRRVAVGDQIWWEPLECQSKWVETTSLKDDYLVAVQREAWLYKPDTWLAYPKGADRYRDSPVGAGMTRDEALVSAAAAGYGPDSVMAQAEDVRAHGGPRRILRRIRISRDELRKATGP